jgi:glutamyl-tRNA synthetase
MRNYLLRLGWSHGNDEIISTEQAIAWFNLESIGKSPSRMDYKKLDNLNGHYIRIAEDQRLAKEVTKLLSRREPPVTLDGKAWARLMEAMPGLKERAKTLVELTNAAEFLFSDGPRTPDEAAAKLLTPEARKVLAELKSIFGAAPEWSAPVLEEKARAFAEQHNLKLGQVAQPLRAALTGKASSPPIFDVLAVLGREESLLRLGAWAP